MPKVSPEYMQARRDQIARAAIAEFSERGIHSTSMANIIAASDLSAGAIYTHFDGKDDIIAYVSRAAVRGVLSGFEQALASRPLPDAGGILRFITKGIGQAEVSPGFIVQVWGEAATNPDVRATTNEVYAEALGFLRDYATRWLTESRGITPQAAAAEAPAHARVLLSAIYAHILQSALISDHDGEALALDFGRVLGGPTPE